MESQSGMGTKQKLLSLVQCILRLVLFAGIDFTNWTVLNLATV